VADNVALPLIIAGVPKREIEQSAARGGATITSAARQERSPTTRAVSTGESKSVAIARAVVRECRRAIDDEPPAISIRPGRRDHDMFKRSTQ